MNYFLDTEFLEGTQKKRFFGIPYGNTLNTIDLISIGIVAEDGREYYAISKDFNIKEAWNRYQIKQVYGDSRNVFPDGIKEYWIRRNVLRPIFVELLKKQRPFLKSMLKMDSNVELLIENEFTYKNFKKLIQKYGKTNEQIAKEIRRFTLVSDLAALQLQNGFDKNELVNRTEPYPGYDTKNYLKDIKNNELVNFYAYYADYDWVVFCWLFGKMNTLPKGFPMYCRDLKQIVDSKYLNQEYKYKGMSRLDAWLQDIKLWDSYPKQDESKKHSAIEDARWNFEFYKFLKKI